MVTEALKKRVELWLSLFIAGLVISGLTAFPLKWEVNLLLRIMIHPGSPAPYSWPALVAWVTAVNDGLTHTYQDYPFLAYGTDWLAFAHLVIAVAFWGPLRDPVRNRWVIEFGMIACLLVLPMALIAGPIRGVPFFWQLVDCSFGVFGFIPLWLCRRDVLQIERREKTAI